MLGNKHPSAMGKPFREVWPETWDTIGPMLRSVLETGVPTYNEDMLLPLVRKGYVEECYFTFSLSPISDGADVGGIFCAVAESSAKIIAERRLRTLYALSSRSLNDVAHQSDRSAVFAHLSARRTRALFLEREFGRAAHRRRTLAARRSGAGRPDARGTRPPSQRPAG